MKSLKITFAIAFLLTLFVLVSSQTTAVVPAEPSKAHNVEPSSHTEADLLAHIVTGIRVPTQG